ESGIQYISETSSIFAGFEFFLRVDNYHTRMRSVECNGELSQLRLNLHLPERAQVETATPQRYVRASISKQQHHPLTKLISDDLQQLDRGHEPERERRAASHAQ